MTKTGRPRKYHFTAEDMDTLSAREISAKYGCDYSYAGKVKSVFEAQKNPTSEWKHTKAHPHFTGGLVYLVHMVPGHPLLSGQITDNRLLQHRLVMYDLMGEEMRVPGSEIHHRGEDPMNNKPTNLIWFATPKGHKGHHANLKKGMGEAASLASMDEEYRIFDPALVSSVERLCRP